MIALEWMVWALFMASSVFGHVALKRATQVVSQAEGTAYWLQLAEHPWTMGAVVSWGLSGLLWVLILRDSTLFVATSVSALRYILIAGAAVWFLGEALETKQVVGMVLVGVGVFLIKA